MIKVEWSARRNRLKIIRHRVDFEKAQTVFNDPQHITVGDPDHSQDERRFITVGHSGIIMAHTFEDDKIRIITARAKGI